MTVTLADLRAMALFDDVRDDDLAARLAVADERTVEPGEGIAAHGVPAPGFVLLLD